MYDTTQDFSLVNNMAAQHSGRLKEMQELFMQEAARFHVLLIDDRLHERTNAALVGRPTVMEGRNQMILHDGMIAMGTDRFMDLRNKGYPIKNCWTTSGRERPLTSFPERLEQWNQEADKGRPGRKLRAN